MEISYLGHSSFLIKTLQATIVTDPFNESIGIKPKEVTADIVTISHHHFDHDNLGIVKGDPVVIDGAGEYDLKGVEIYGVPSFHDKSKGSERGGNTIFVVESEEIRLCHLGDLGLVLSEGEIEKLGEIDILFTPIGGKYTIDSDEAVKLISLIEPNIVIPMHYKTEGINLDIDTIEDFVEEMGIKDKKPKDKLVVKKGGFNEEETEAVVLKVQN